MPLLNVTLKEDAPASELAKAKQAYIDAGCEIKHEYTLIKGFTVEVPDDKVGLLSSNDHINVEEDKEVHTQ